MAETALITIYATDWCPFCQRLRKNLDRSEIPYAVIDVDADAEASAWVESVNAGNRIVPTVRYSDGEVTTNPAASEVRRKYAALQEAH